MDSKLRTRSIQERASSASRAGIQSSCTSRKGDIPPRLQSPRPEKTHAFRHTHPLQGYAEHWSSQVFRRCVWAGIHRERPEDHSRRAARRRQPTCIALPSFSLQLLDDQPAGLSRRGCLMPHKQRWYDCRSYRFGSGPEFNQSIGPRPAHPKQTSGHLILVRFRGERPPRLSGRHGSKPERLLWSAQRQQADIRSWG
jgi:hypothetical protein